MLHGFSEVTLQQRLEELKVLADAKKLVADQKLKSFCISITLFSFIGIIGLMIYYEREIKILKENRCGNSSSSAMN